MPIHKVTIPSYFKGPDPSDAKKDTNSAIHNKNGIIKSATLKQALNGDAGDAKSTEMKECHPEEKDKATAVIQEVQNGHAIDAANANDKKPRKIKQINGINLNWFEQKPKENGTFNHTVGGINKKPAPGTVAHNVRRYSCSFAENSIKAFNGGTIQQLTSAPKLAMENGVASRNVADISNCQKTPVKPLRRKELAEMNGVKDEGNTTIVDSKMTKEISKSIESSKVEKSEIEFHSKSSKPLGTAIINDLNANDSSAKVNGVVTREVIENKNYESSSKAIVNGCSVSEESRECEIQDGKLASSQHTRQLNSSNGSALGSRTTKDAATTRETTTTTRTVESSFSTTKDVQYTNNKYEKKSEESEHLSNSIVKQELSTKMEDKKVINSERSGSLQDNKDKDSAADKKVMENADQIHENGKDETNNNKPEMHRLVDIKIRNVHKDEVMNVTLVKNFNQHLLEEKRNSLEESTLKQVKPSERTVRSHSVTDVPRPYSLYGHLPREDDYSVRSTTSPVSELRADLAEEQATLTHTAEMLEAETSERMKLEKEVQNLQAECAQMRQQTDRMEMDMMETRMFHNAELNGDLSDEDDLEAAGSIYRQKYERLVRELELTKRRLQQKHEEEMEQHILAKKAVDKRLADALEDLEEEKQFASQWKRKAQKLTAEMQDLRLLLQENMNRNSDLEKKQRRFDAELSSAQEEARKEKFNRERLQREKELALAEKYAVEQELQSCRMDMDLQSEKIAQLNRELEELTLSSHGEEEVTQLKRTKQELERKLKDQEEELEELAGQVSLLEQAKLRLEMSLEKSRQESRREISVREEEMEELRASFSKKLKNLEAQLEAEQEDRHQLVRQKHELERRILEMSEQPPPRDPEIERRLRRDLKRTKALLRDAQSMLEHTRNGQANKTLIRQLKNQVEDAEFAKTAAIKARQGAELELQDIQAQLEEVLRVKNEAESRCLQLSREKSSLQTQLEEMEEEQSEIMKKYKAVVQQMSSDQKLLTDQSSQISDLEAEKQSLRDQITDLTAKLESLMGNSVDTGVQRRLEARVKELESRLDLEQSHRSRLENQVTRLKEQSDRLLEESENLRSKEQQAQEACKRVQRQLRELREDYALLKQKEAEALQKQHELQMALENSAADLQATKNDLRLACQRIQDLQSALEEDIDSDTDIGDEESDSDSSTEVSSILSKSLSPTYRLNRLSTSTSEASLDLGLQCSRTSSFSHDLPSSLMWMRMMPDHCPT